MILPDADCKGRYTISKQDMEGMKSNLQEMKLIYIEACVPPYTIKKLGKTACKYEVTVWFVILMDYS